MMNRKSPEQHTLLTSLLGVTLAFSILYPLCASIFGAQETNKGIMLGLVATVVGAMVVLLYRIGKKWGVFTR